MCIVSYVCNGSEMNAVVVELSSDFVMVTLSL